MSTNAPLMRRATAIWLIEKTALSFEQIAEFCDIHLLEVQAMADGEAGSSMIGFDPVASGQLTMEEIHRCEQDHTQDLRLNQRMSAEALVGKKKTRYTPVSKRHDRPDAIAWLLKYYPDLPEAVIVRLIGTTKQTIQSVRNRTHWNSQNIKPKNPVNLGICTQVELDEALRHVPAAVISDIQ